MDFRAVYIKILKSSGVTANFDYAFYLPAERKKRFEEKNKELLSMGFSGRTLNTLNRLEIFTSAGISTLTEEFLLEKESCGAGTVREIKDILAKNNIELRREQDDQSIEAK
jgi:DNA-directed RNA polymerase alpha subunit